MAEIFKCEDCGCDTTNSYDIWNSQHTGVLATVHRCDKCQNRLDLEFDFQSEGETIDERELVCPWCKEKFEGYDAYQYEEGETEAVECPFCGKHFDLEIEEVRRYSTKRSLCDMPEDYGEETNA